VQKRKIYKGFVFSPEVIAEALRKISVLAEIETLDLSEIHINIGDEKWDYDAISEFYNDYRDAFEYAQLKVNYSEISFSLECYGVKCESVYTEVGISHQCREEIQSIFQVFEANLSDSTVSEADLEIPRNPPKSARKPNIFIGHGRDPQWKELKQHLQDLHGYHVQAYETGARSGHTIRDILDQMLQTSSFAILVHSAEDLMADGKYQARPNVIHETGLFQGKLGFPRVAILLEAGAEDFSNLQGIHQIRYTKGNIRETFGDVLATLRREFGANPVG
jgi:predicted nucleotide-binding protein